MRKQFLVLAAGLLTLATACTSEEQMGVENDGYNVTLNVFAPEGVMSRAYGDGLKADQLTYTVYDDNGNLVQNAVTKTNAFPENGLKDKVQLKLVTGKTYRITFWAQNSGATCYTQGTNGSIVVDYAGLANDENRDAFYACDTITVVQNTERNVYLRRPFAQINVGTTKADYTAAVEAKIDVTKTSFTMEAPSTLDMFDGTVSNPVTVNYTANAVPNTTLGANPSEDLTLLTHSSKYVYLAMNYVLVGAEKEVVGQVTMGTDGVTEDKVFGSIPVQRNYRTNIVGNLLTASYDFNVFIEPGFYDEYNVTLPDYFADVINNGGTLELTTDLTLSEIMTIPAGKEVTINLNGHKIINTNTAATPLLFLVKGTLTINGEGTIDGGEGGNNQAVHVVSGGKAVLNGGTYTVGSDANGNGNACIEAEGTGQIEINGGHYSCKSAYAGKYFVLNGHDNSPVAIVVKGGSFVNCNPAATGLEPAGQNDNWVAAGYHVETTTDGTNTIYTVVAD